MTYDWVHMNVLPIAGLEAWHQFTPGVTGNNVMYDSSGHNRHISSAPSNTTFLVADTLNADAGMYFPGNASPLVYSGSLVAKHIFIVASYGLATFADYKGLLSDTTTNALLVGEPTTDKFLDLSAGILGFAYRKADRLFTPSNQKAPVGGAFAVIEIQNPTGYNLDGIQVGQDRNFSTRKWQGFFIEDLIYSSIKTELERCRIYEYLAMRYHLWQEKSDNLPIFPFPANKTRNRERDTEHYLSQPYSGSDTALIRATKHRFEAPFSLRLQAEVDAAEKFHEEHYPDPSKPCVFRDWRFYPPRDTTCRITSPFRETGSDVTYRFNYSLEFTEY